MSNFHIWYGNILSLVACNTSHCRATRRDAEPRGACDDFTKSRPQRTASCPAAPRREDGTEFYPKRRDAIHRSNRVLLTSGTYPYLHFTWSVMRAIKNSAA